MYFGGDSVNKLLKIIVVLVIMATFGEVSHGAEYLKSVEFTEKNIAKNITWSGKEWITDTYPPKISQNRTKELSLYLCMDRK